MRSESKPINGAPPVIIGSKPVDGGYLIFDANERAELLHEEPEAGKWLRPFLGAEEYLNGGERWIASLQNAPPHELARLPKLHERVRRVKAWRSGDVAPKNAKDAAARRAENSVAGCKLIDTPRAYHVTVIPNASFLAIPEVSSENRAYVPMGWLEPPVIPSNLLRILPNATPYHFGIVTSRMHMAWMRHIAGRLKSDYRYSISLVYNTFPWPETSDAQRAKLAKLAQAVLDKRALAKNAASTLAILYGEHMPDDLRKAHTSLDIAVDRLYRRKAFTNDLERVHHLLACYEAVIEPISNVVKKGARNNRRTENAVG